VSFFAKIGDFDPDISGKPPETEAPEVTDD
jgi:hypothetical protein